MADATQASGVPGAAEASRAKAVAMPRRVTAYRGVPQPSVLPGPSGSPVSSATTSPIRDCSGWPGSV
jgi:hypothetical protein